MSVNCYLLIDPPGDDLVNVQEAIALAFNSSANPVDMGRSRLSLDGQQAIVAGTFEQSDIDALAERGWLVMQMNHRAVLEYLQANPENWEPQE